MENVFVAWEQFAYGNTCSREKRKGSVASVIRRSKTHSIAKTVKIGAVATVLAFSVPVGASATAVPRSKYVHQLQHLNVGKYLGSELTVARKFLRLTRDEAALLIGVSPSSIQKLEDGQIAFPDSYPAYKSFIEMADYLENALGGRKFAATALLREKLSAFGDQSALDLAKSDKDALSYIYATFRRMYG